MLYFVLRTNITSHAFTHTICNTYSISTVYIQYTPSTVSHQVTISYEEGGTRCCTGARSIRARRHLVPCDPSYPLLLLILHLCEGYTNISCLLILGPRLIVRCGGWERVEPGVGRVELFLGEHVGEQLGKLARSLHLHTALPRLKQPGGRPTLAHPRHMSLLSSSCRPPYWRSNGRGSSCTWGRQRARGSPPSGLAPPSNLHWTSLMTHAP